MNDKCRMEEMSKAGASSKPKFSLVALECKEVRGWTAAAMRLAFKAEWLEMELADHKFFFLAKDVKRGALRLAKRTKRFERITRKMLRLERIIRKLQKSNRTLAARGRTWSETPVRPETKRKYGLK